MYFIAIARPEPADRLQRADLARPRGAHGGRRLHDGDPASITSTGATSGRSRSRGSSPGVVGFLVGIPALRLSGLYLAIATFGLAVAMPPILKKFDGLHRRLRRAAIPRVGADPGHRPRRDVTIFGHSMTQNHLLYYLTWTIALIRFAVAWLIVRGTPGPHVAARSATARSPRPPRASASPAYKTLAFGDLGVLRGRRRLAATRSRRTIVNPRQLPVRCSRSILVGAVVGGLGSLAGLVARRGVFVAVPADGLERGHLRPRPERARSRVRRGLIVVMIAAPRRAPADSSAGCPDR